MKRPPELGSTELVSINGTDVKFAVRHVGPRAARAWTRRLEANRRDEADRLRAARRARVAEYNGDEAAAKAADPALWSDEHQTPEAEPAQLALFDAVVAEAIAGAEGIDGVDPTDVAAAVRQTQYLDAVQALELFVACLSQQRLDPRQSFLAEGSGVAVPEVAPASDAA